MSCVLGNISSLMNAPRERAKPAPLIQKVGARGLAGRLGYRSSYVVRS